MSDTRTDLQKMAAGEWYNCLGAELEALRARARAAVHAHNTLPPDQRGAMAPALASLFGDVGPDCFLEAPFHCAYGHNIHLAAGIYINAGCTFLDTATIQIGAQTMLGPAVQIYCAEHHKDADLRCAGLEIARPVIIGAQVWIGGGAIILPGVAIGDRSIVAAGSVVTRNVPPDTIVRGNPARA